MSSRPIPLRSSLSSFSRLAASSETVSTYGFISGSKRSGAGNVVRVTTSSLLLIKPVLLIAFCKSEATFLILLADPMSPIWLSMFSTVPSPVSVTYWTAALYCFLVYVLGLKSGRDAGWATTGSFLNSWTRYMRWEGLMLSTLVSLTIFSNR